MKYTFKNDNKISSSPLHYEKGNFISPKNILFSSLRLYSNHFRLRNLRHDMGETAQSIISLLPQHRTPKKPQKVQNHQLQLQKNQPRS